MNDFKKKKTTNKHQKNTGTEKGEFPDFFTHQKKDLNAQDCTKHAFTLVMGNRKFKKLNIDDAQETISAVKSLQEIQLNTMFFKLFQSMKAPTRNTGTQKVVVSIL